VPPSNYVYTVVWNTSSENWNHTPYGIVGPWGNYIGWMRWGKCYQDPRNTNTHEASGITYVSTDTLNEEARIELWTGGDASVTNNDNVIMVSVGARDDSTLAPIPVSELTMLGQTPTPEYGTNIYAGEVWMKDVCDHAKIAATPTAARSCYSYAANVSKNRLVITGNAGPGELNGKTNVVYVGERINLSIRNGLITSKAGVTNYKWSVPGYRIGYWNATVPRAHTSPFDSTNRYAVEFFWVDAIASAVVTCSVEVGGHTLTASTTADAASLSFWFGQSRRVEGISTRLDGMFGLSVTRPWLPNGPVTEPGSDTKTGCRDCPETCCAELK
jgi:hypothetical protein